MMIKQIQEKQASKKKQTADQQDPRLVRCAAQNAAVQNTGDRRQIQGGRRGRIGFSPVLASSQHRLLVVPEGGPASLHPSCLRVRLFLCVIRYGLKNCGIDILIQTVIVIQKQPHLCRIQTDAVIEFLIVLIGRKLLEIIQLGSGFKKSLKLLPVAAAVARRISRQAKSHSAQRQRRGQPADLQEIFHGIPMDYAALLPRCRGVLTALHSKTKLRGPYQKGQRHKRSHKKHHFRAQQKAGQNQQDRRQKVGKPASCPFPRHLHGQKQKACCPAKDPYSHGILQINKVLRQKSCRSGSGKANGCCPA